MSPNAMVMAMVIVVVRVEAGRTFLLLFVKNKASFLFQSASI